MRLVDSAQKLELTKALEGLGTPVTPAGHLCWNFTVSNGRPLPVTARIDDGFLLLDAPAGFRAGVPALPQLLEWNSDLAAAAKFALLPSPWRTRLRAEFVLDEETDLPVRLLESLNGFLGGASRLHASDSCEAASGAALRPDNAGRSALGRIPDLLKQTGWQFQERDSGQVKVDLEARGGLCQAAVGESASGVIADVELARADSMTPSSRLAVAAFLLTLNGALRLVRGYMQQAESQIAIGLQVRFGAFPSAGEMDHALAALSVACQACARETRILLDKTVAEQYLAILDLPLTFDEKETTHG